MVELKMAFIRSGNELELSKERRNVKKKNKSKMCVCRIIIQIEYELCYWHMCF